ncbi:MAG: hypothetical protein ACE5GE_11200 [Phycisphaerae bacterium]
MIGRFVSIAANTFLETIRQPLYGVILLVTALMLILNLGLAGFTLEDDDKLLLDLGLSTLLVSGLFLSVFSATGVLSREIENKTVLTVVSKPVSRPLLIAGKYTGLMTALAMAMYLAFLMFLLTIRHQVLQNTTDPWDMPVIVFGFGALSLSLSIGAFLNFYSGKEFASTTLALFTPLLTLATILTGFWNKTWELQAFGEGIWSINIVWTGVLMLMAVMVLAAIALAASTRLSQVMTLLVCVLVTMMGLVSDFVLGERAADSAVANALYKTIPNLGLYSAVDAVTSDVLIPTSYIAMAGGYTLLMVTAALLIGVALFQRREVG